MSRLLRALVRPIPRSFAQATVEHPTDIDTIKAMVQHGAYIDALSELVDEVLWAPAAHAAPDSVFVEDQVVVCDGHALFTRSGCPSRRIEQEGLREVLLPLVRPHYMDAPATLDGGDVLRVGRYLFVGLSSRTNEAGVAVLRETFAPIGFEVHAIRLPSGLHLKCFCTALGEDTIVAATQLLPADCFLGTARVIDVPPHEAYGANVLCRGREVIMAAGMPETEHALTNLGYSVTQLDVSEIRKADGALTCMSVWF